MTCTVCGTDFDGEHRALTCSKPCRQKRISAQKRARWAATVRDPIFNYCVVCGDRYMQERQEKTCGALCSAVLTKTRQARDRVASRDRTAARSEARDRLREIARIENYPPGTRGVWDCKGGVITRVC